MRLICFWCFLLAAVRGQDIGYYAPQTFRQNMRGPVLFQPAPRPWEAALQDIRWNKIPESYGKGLFSPARNDVSPQGSIAEPWRPQLQAGAWSGPAPQSPPPPPTPVFPKSEPWRLPYALSKEQQAAILHHKQALTSEGSFRFEYASDNGLAAGEVIEPDGSRVGGYQYKDPSGQLVKLKYRAGKDGFQILEGSHIPKSPEPVPPLNQENHYMQAYAQQRQQYELQQQYNQQRPDPNQNQQGGQQSAGGQYFVQNWRPGQGGPEDDGQYRENEVQDKGPHNFGTGYSFAFQG